MQSIAGNAGHCIAHCIHAANCIYSKSRIFYAFHARRDSFVLIVKESMTFSAAACSQSPVTPAIVLRIACYWPANSTPPLAFSTRYRTDVTDFFLNYSGHTRFFAIACNQSPVTPTIVLRIAFMQLTASSPNLGYSTHFSPDDTVLFSSSKDL